MDKENSGNLEDVLEQLKNKVENTESAPSDAPLQDDMSANSEPMDADLLTERLRQQFMTESDSGEGETQADEYNIDSDLISEFYEEAQNTEETLEVTEESEAYEEVQEIVEEEYSEPIEENIYEEDNNTEVETSTPEAQEGEIVEIVIPWVEKIEDELAHEDEIEDFGGELNEDYFDDEASENSYVCFADDEMVDEEIFEQNEELEEVEDGEYDLPWYDDLPGADEEKETDEDLPLTLEEVETDNIILPVGADEYDEEEDEVDLIMDESDDEIILASAELTEAEKYSEQMDIDDVFVAENDEVIADIQKPYSLFEKPNIKAEPNVDFESDEENASFYRMIIDERTKRENAYGYFSDNTGDEIGEQNEQMPDSVEDIDIPEFKYGSYVSVDLSGSSGDGANADSEEVSDDFYGIDEHAVNFGDDKNSDAMPKFDYDHEESHSEIHTESDTTNVVWRRAKPILLAVIALAILILELLPVLNVVPDGMFDYTSYPWTYIFIDAQLLIFAAAICYKKLFDGFFKLFSSESNIYSVLSMTIIVTLLGSILSCFSAGEVVPKLYNFISAAYLLAVYLLEKIDNKRISDSINVLSGDSVFTLKRSQGKNSCAEKMYAGGLDPDTSILEPVEVENEGFEGVFSRERIWKNKRFSNNLVVSSAIPITVFSIFVAMISIVTSAGLSATVNAFSFTFVLLAPLSATIAYYLPILISYRRLSKRGCVIAGYEGAETIADCDAVVFADGHLFKDCDASDTGIKLYCDDSKTRELFVCLGAVYSKIGGPMQNTFSSVLGDEAHNVKMVRITRSGFEAVVDNKANLIVGSSEYLSRYGIMTDRADAKELGIVYVAMNSLLCAKISATYKTQPLFEQLSEILDDYDVRTVIETYDPIISGKYVAKCRHFTAAPISVVHKNINDYNSSDKGKSALGRAGAFVTSSRLKLVELLTFCKRITKLRRINTAFLVTSYAVAAVACVLLLFGGIMEEMNLLWALLYQAIFVSLCTLVTARFLPLSFDGLQKKKERQELKIQERENRFQYE